jgi:hypothetical protein
MVERRLLYDHAFISSSETTEVDVRMLAHVDVFVFDFGHPLLADSHKDLGLLPAPLARAFAQTLFKTVCAEHERLRRGEPPRQIIAINAINNVFEGWVTRHIGAGVTPYATRLRHGFVLPLENRIDWTPWLEVGEAGVLDGSMIRAREDQVGTVMYGPYRSMMPGHYRLVLKVSGEASKELPPDNPVAVLEIASRRTYLSHRVVTAGDVATGSIAIEVGITEELALELDFALETRLRTLEPLRLAIIELICERLSDVAPAAPQHPVLEIENWLPLLYMGPAGGRRNRVTINRTGRPGHLLYGPYWALPAGEYKANFQLVDIAKRHAGNASDVACSFEVVSGNDHLGLAGLRREDLQDRVSLGFTVTREQAQDSSFALELLVWDNAVVPFGVEAVTLRRLGEPAVRLPGEPDLGGDVN